MPDSFELPRMWIAVIKLMCRERFAGFLGTVVNELIAFALWHSLRRGRRLAGWRSRLEPGLAAVVRTLNYLAEPAACLRGVNAVRIHFRTFNMINLPSREVRSTNMPIFTLPI
jgi:hypothetical protein